jgi:hypothetical protein
VAEKKGELGSKGPQIEKKKMLYLIMDNATNMLQYKTIFTEQVGLDDSWKREVCRK